MDSNSSSKLKFKEEAYYPHKILQEGVYNLSIEDFEREFVLNLEDFDRRNSLFEGFNKFNIELRNLLSDGYTLWVDGSFVECKKEPGDIDLVVFCAAEQYCKLSDKKQCRLRVLTNKGCMAKDEYFCHAFLEFFWPDTDPHSKLFKEQSGYWSRWFGNTRELTVGNRTVTGYKKGFIQIVQGKSPPFTSQDSWR